MNPSTAETVRARSMSSPPALILSSPIGRHQLGLLIFIVLFTKLENERSISSDFILCLFPWDLTSPPQWMVHYAMNGTLRCKVVHDFLALLEQQNPNCDIFWISIFFLSVLISQCNISKMFLVRLLKLAMSEDCGIIEVYVLKYHPNDSFIKFVRKDFLLYPVTFL